MTFGALVAETKQARWMDHDVECIRHLNGLYRMKNVQGLDEEIRGWCTVEIAEIERDMFRRKFAEKQNAQRPGWTFMKKGTKNRLTPIVPSVTRKCKGGGAK